MAKAIYWPVKIFPLPIPLDWWENSIRKKVGIMDEETKKTSVSTRENTWPDGRRRALEQAEHRAWNSSNYPGTRQLCESCGEPTGRCEDDSILSAEGLPLCESCGQRTFH